MTEPTQPDREPADATPPPDARPPDPDAAPTPETSTSDAAPPPDDIPRADDVPPADQVPPTPLPVEQVAPVAPAPVAASPAAARRPATILGYVGVAILGMVLGAGALGIATGQLGGASPSPSPTPAPSEAPAGNTVGQADAPVTIEVWADYQCPYCRLEDLLFGGALEREYVMPGIARVVYRDFSFLGQESTDAAVAARCAGAQDPAAQLRFHDALYTFQQGENQGRFVRENLVQIAEIAGVRDAAAFKTCLDDPAIAQAVADETTAGRNVGVTSTPTMRLRGPGGERVLTGFSQTWPPLREAVEAVRVAPAASPSPAGSPAAPSSGSPGPSATGSPTPAASPAATAGPSPTASAAP